MGIYSYPPKLYPLNITRESDDYYNEIYKSLQNDSEPDREITVENEKYKTIKIICGTILLGLVFQILGALVAFKFYVEHTHPQIPYDPNEIYVKAGLQQCSYVDENEKLAIKEGYDDPYRNDGVKFLWKKECK